MLKVFLKEDQTTYTAVSVMEGMDALKSHMKGYDYFRYYRD